MKRQVRFTGMYIGCPVCGRLRLRKSFIRGALGHSLRAMKQEIFDGKSQMKWSRRPMQQDEVELVGRAVATAALQIEERLGEKLPDELPDDDDILTSIASNDEFIDVAKDWLAEAEEELQRRRAIVDEQLQRRQIREAS